MQAGFFFQIISTDEQENKLFTTLCESPYLPTDQNKKNFKCST